MEIVTEGIEDYMLRLAGESDPVLRELEEYAEEEDFPIVGPLVGRVLRQLALLTGAQRILELGSGFGYSAYWFAKGMASSGEVILTEYRQENLDRARDALERGGLDPAFRYLQGDSLEIIDGLDGSFEIVFIDIDKQDYPKAFDKAARRVRRGGLLIADNVLWHGKVADPDLEDGSTRGVLEYNNRAFSHPEFLTSILPIRDGVALSLRR